MTISLVHKSYGTASESKAIMSLFCDRYVYVLGLNGYPARVFPLLSKRSMLQELFVGRTVYFEPCKTKNGSNVRVVLLRSIVPRTDNVWLLVADNTWGLTELVLHCPDKV